MEDIVFVVVFAAMLPACIYGFRHAERFERAVSGQDVSDDFLRVPASPSRQTRVFALRAAFVSGMVIAISGFVIVVLLATGVLSYD